MYIYVYIYDVLCGVMWWYRWLDGKIKYTSEANYVGMTLAEMWKTNTIYK